MLSQTQRYLHITPIPESITCPLIERFASVSQQDYSLLFDSSDLNNHSRRFSIMLWSPSHLVTTANGRTILHDVEANQHVFAKCDAIHNADDLLAVFSQSISVTEASQSHAAQLPFQVGLAGYAGYDHGRTYLKISGQDTQYTAPDLCIGLYQCSIIHDHESDQQYYCYVSPSADADPHALDTLPAVTEYAASDPDFTILDDWQANMNKQEYITAIDAIHDYLVAGDCYQTNFAQRFETKFKGDPFAIYRLLREKNKVPYSSYMCIPSGAVISISPERFLAVNDGIVETKPIKGTRPRSQDKQQDQTNAQALLNSSKDRAENLMIVDLLRNDLSKHCKPNSVQVPSLFAIESYDSVHHLVSTVQGKLADSSTPLQLFQDAFPGGSITGAPKVRAMEIIAELEPHKRAIYCGSMLYVGWRQDMDSSICIRTLLAEHDTLYCWAGGGIVYDSDAHAEYQETFDKVGKILPELQPTTGQDE